MCLNLPHIIERMTLNKLHHHHFHTRTQMR